MSTAPGDEDRTLVSGPSRFAADGASTAVDVELGTSYGPYTVGKRLGEGGFGAVYEAEQEFPVRRRVALKIIKLGMDTQEVLARFEAERQALALMEHPNIARVLDVGTSTGGRPYFVMELVHGEPISTYCDSRRLSIVERLQLFDQLCQGVQHAHTKGVIHRDLKPNNVLVSTEGGQPLVKVIDFGIAKATSGHLTEYGLLTAQLQTVGTPLYMSPEQAQGSIDIDTRSDIFALGVLLYQLLTDSTPFESNTIRTGHYAEILHYICEVDPPHPSVRLGQLDAPLSEVADKRRLEPQRLISTVRGELDWIVMKAIEKDRTRRYETADALAMDVRRYLAGQPLLAAPPSRVYRVKKFVRRHRLAVGAASLVALTLLAAIVGFAWLARIAQQQAQIAEQRARELQQVSKFQSDMLAQVNPTAAGVLLTDDVIARHREALQRAGVSDDERASRSAGFAAEWAEVNATDAARSLIDSTILKPAIGAIDRQFARQPLVEAGLRQALAERYLGLGLHDAALPLQRRALQINRELRGELHPETLRSSNMLGALLQAQGKLDEAEGHLRDVLEKRLVALGPNHLDTLKSTNMLGGLLYAQGRLHEAEGYLRETLEQRRRVLGNDHLSTLQSLNNMGAVLQDQGKLMEAEPFFREALEKRRQVRGEDHHETLSSLNNLGTLLIKQGKLAEAEPLLVEAVERKRRVMGAQHPQTLASLHNLGGLQFQWKNLDEAETFLREATQGRRQMLGNEHPDTLTSMDMLGRVMHAKGALDAAEPYLLEALQTQRRIHGDTHATTLLASLRLANLRNAQGRHSEAIALLQTQEPAWRKTFKGDGNHARGQFLMALGTARLALGEYEEAEALLLEAQDAFAASRQRRSDEARECLEALVELYAAWHVLAPDRGHDASAEGWREQLRAFDAPGVNAD